MKTISTMKNRPLPQIILTAFFALFVSVGFSQNVTATREEGLRKVSTNPYRYSNFDVHIDEEVIERNIEVALQNALRHVEVALDRLEINIEPIEIDLSSLNNSIDPIDIHIPDLDIDIDIDEMDMDEDDFDIDIDITEDFHFDWDEDEAEEEEEDHARYEGLRRIHSSEHEWKERNKSHESEEKHEHKKDKHNQKEKGKGLKKIE